MNKYHKIVSAKPLDEYKIEITFDDGYSKIVNLKEKIRKGISRDLENQEVFKSVKIGTGGELYWENGFDLCPNALRQM